MATRKPTVNSTKANPTSRVKAPVVRTSVTNPKRRQIKPHIRTTRDNVDKAVRWLYDFAGNKINSRKIPPEAFNPRAKDNVFIGGVFLYSYDPRHKDTLPWYDKLPVIIPIEPYPDGWLGLNLHYLAPPMRAALMNQLMALRRRAHSPRAYMKVSYQFLRGLLKVRWMEPCLKRYLTSHVRSRIIRVSDEYWEQVAMLPIQQFVKADSRTIWGHYGRKYKKPVKPSGSRKTKGKRR